MHLDKIININNSIPKKYTGIVEYKNNLIQFYSNGDYNVITNNEFIITDGSYYEYWFNGYKFSNEKQWNEAIKNFYSIIESEDEQNNKNI